MNTRLNPQSKSYPFFRNVIIKSMVLFIFFNFLYLAADPIDELGRVSAYNVLFPGRKRLPFGERPDLAYNLTVDNLSAMLASHEIDGLEKEPGEYRVFVIGDSSVWGYLLPPDETLSAQINDAAVRLDDGRQVRAFNLGYPTLSITKDLFILSHAIKYKPDLILWFVTLDAMLWEKQLSSPILQNNRDGVEHFIRDWQLPITINTHFSKSIWENTILGQRRLLADWFRLQLYGSLWAATGIDQAYPDVIEPPQSDFTADESFYNFSPSEFGEAELAFSVLAAGIRKFGRENIVLVNEPVFISSGENSHLRYNFLYPRWAYDEYRYLVQNESQQSGWKYVDGWDKIQPEEFTNSAIHISQKGTSMLVQELIDAVFAGDR